MQILCFVAWTDLATWPLSREKWLGSVACKRVIRRGRGQASLSVTSVSPPVSGPGASCGCRRCTRRRSGPGESDTGRRLLTTLTGENVRFSVQYQSVLH